MLKNSAHSDTLKDAVLLAFCALLPLLPLLTYLTQNIDSYDFLFYTGLIDQVGSRIWQGDLYPRWLSEANSGLGSPAFLYYPPLAYFIAALFPVADDATGIVRFCMGTGLAAMLAAAFFYLLCREHMARKMAVAAAIIFILLPYRLHVAYVQFGMSVGWATCFAMLTLYMLARWRGGACALKWAALPLAGVLLSHMLSFIVFAPLPFIYVLAHSDAKRTDFTALLKTYGLVLALGAFYLLPAWANTAFIQQAHLTQGTFDYRENFFATASDLFALPYLLLGALALYIYVRKNGFATLEKSGLYAFAAAGFALVAFFIIPLSKPVWSVLSPLAWLQFPYRFYFDLALVFPLLMLLVPSRTWFATVLALCVAGCGFHLWFAFTHVPQNANAMVEETRARRILIPHEYNSAWAASPDPRTLDFYRALPETACYFDDAQNKLVSYSRQDGDITCSVEITADNATLTFRRFYFPNISAHNAKTGAEYKTTPSPVYALAQINLPKGNHEISLQTRPFQGVFIGYLISLIALGFTLTPLANRKKHPR